MKDMSMPTRLAMLTPLVNSGKGVQATAGDVRSVPNGQFERRKAA